uniref:CD82 antigen-like n=1 Tax=Styela clava TaxID=7725 RepID=UPI00193AC436|nr:CD82 antigen-like [Styela clava]
MNNGDENNGLSRRMDKKGSASIIWLEKNENLTQGQEGWISCGRYALVVFNMLFFILGAFLVCYSVWFTFVPANQNLMSIVASGMTRNNIEICMYIIGATGVCTVLLAYLGCCAAVSNNKYILGLFFLFLVVLFVQLVTVGALSVWLRFEVKADIDYYMKKSLMEMYLGDNAVNQQSVAWKSVQSGLKCCGFNSIEGYKDFSNVSGKYPDGSKWWILQTNNPKKDRWPDSCCINRHSFLSNEDRIKCHLDTSKPEDVIYTKGCRDKVESFINENLLVVTAMAILLALIEIVHFTTVRQLEAALSVVRRPSVATMFSVEDQPKSNKQL